MNWYGVSNRDPRVVALYSRHYSSKHKTSKADWLRYGIAPNGSDMTLLTQDGLALFGWLFQQKRDDHQPGVQCYIFRNEGRCKSSDLILQAMELAWRKWPNQRLWTYVNPAKVKSVNPGYCFKQAGWRYCGQSKGGLHILEIREIEA